MAEYRKRTRRKRQTAKAERRDQEVVYTPPAPINRRQLILMVASIVAVAVAIFLGLSVFFRVDAMEFRVQGNRMYSADTIWKASNIKDGDSLIGFGKARAASSIMQQLPFVKSVRIQITLPDTVTVFVEELTVYLAAQDTQGQWWFISTEGKVLEKTNAIDAAKWTLLQGIRLESPVAGQMAKAAGNGSEGSPVAQTNAEKLKTALDIAIALEDEEILDSISNIDATHPNDISFWYTDRLLVKLGNIEQISEKIVLVHSTIKTQLGIRDAGILHVSNKNGIRIEFERRKFE